MNWLQGVAPALALWGIGLSVMFNGLNWCKEKDTHKLGKLVFAIGLLLIVIGLVVSFLASGDVWWAWVTNLIALLVAIAAVVLGLRFIYKGT